MERGREARGRALFESIMADKDGRYFCKTSVLSSACTISSQTKADKEYSVTDTTCTCLDKQYRPEVTQCKHMIARQLWLHEKDANPSFWNFFTPEPAPEPAPEPSPELGPKPAPEPAQVTALLHWRASGAAAQSRTPRHPLLSWRLQ